MTRALLAAALFLAPLALAQDRGVEGVGRISVTGGWRWTPNWYFVGKAAEAGAPVTRGSPGGPCLSASFGYGATEWLEGTIDLFGAGEQFTLDGYQPFQSYSYGALLGFRLARLDWPLKGLVPHAGIQVGPTVSNVFSAALPNEEKAILGLSANGGLDVRLTERLALSFDVRYLAARMSVPGLAGINVGGVFFTVGVALFFAPTPKIDLSIPGFSSP